MSNDDLMCGICLEVVNLPVKVPSCSHVFCFLCLKGVINRLGKRCPLCRSAFSEDAEKLCLDKEVYDEVISSQKKRVKAIIKDKVQWQYAGRNVGWWDYDPVSNTDIENAYYLSGHADDADADDSSSDGKIDEMVLSVGATSYNLNFREMIQSPLHHPNRKRAIRRIVIPASTDDEHQTKGIAGLDKKQMK